MSELNDEDLVDYEEASYTAAAPTIRHCCLSGRAHIGMGT